MGVPILSFAFLQDYWLDDDFLDDDWIAPIAPDINWNDNDLLSDEDWSDDEWIINNLDA